MSGDYIRQGCSVIKLHPALDCADSGVADVEKINSWAFYDFGKTIEALRSLTGNVSTKTAFWPIVQAKNALEQLLLGRPVPLGLSTAKARALLDRVSQLYDERFNLKDAKGESTFHFPDDNDPAIPEWRFEWIRSGVVEFETVFAEEMRETATYFVPRKGIYFTPALVDAADETFPTALLPVIPQKARDDWRAAGRCLAFNLLSASGFHVARAVEACLEAYYGLFSGKTGQTLHSWYDYIKALKEIAEKNPMPCPSEKVLAELDQMREDYRNPIVHPRVVLSEGDARMLFANGESLIIAMAQEMVEAAKGVQLTLVAGNSGGAASA
jgi:hypothetical protein